VDERESGNLGELFRADPEVVTWWGSDIECVSALSRRERLGEISTDLAGIAHRRMRTLFMSWYVIEPSTLVKETAMRLLRVHPLRAGDSLQLAAALTACSQQSEALDFVCLDERLSAAARREGFNVIGI
jgi:predicted nucleic acid-binding protein